MEVLINMNIGPQDSIIPRFLTTKLVDQSHSMRLRKVVHKQINKKNAIQRSKNYHLKQSFV